MVTAARYLLRFLFYLLPDILCVTLFMLFYSLRVDSIAHGLIYVIRCAQNGSIWISEDGKPVYEIQLTDSLPLKSDELTMEETL